MAALMMQLAPGESDALCEFACGLPTSRLRRGGSTSPLAPAASGQGRAGVEKNPLGARQAGKRAAPVENSPIAPTWAMIEARLCEAPFFGGAHLTTACIMMVYRPAACFAANPSIPIPT
jgi:glutathione S-transferase